MGRAEAECQREGRGEGSLGKEMMEGGLLSGEIRYFRDRRADSDTVGGKTRDRKMQRQREKLRLRRQFNLRDEHSCKPGRGSGSQMTAPDTPRGVERLQGGRLAEATARNMAGAAEAAAARQACPPPSEVLPPAVRPSGPPALTGEAWAPLGQMEACPQGSLSTTRANRSHHHQPGARHP